MVRILEKTLRELAESYLGAAIPPLEWDRAKAYAEHKLAFIIEHFGDDGGARREPWYLAKLIAETVQADILSIRLKQLADLQRAKKDSPRNHARPSLTNAYCSTCTAALSSTQ